MLKRKIVNGTFCVLLSAILVITMISALTLSSVAQATAPVISQGEWVHQNNDGKGTNYVTMSVDALEYYFVQTKNNEQFSFTPEFSAFKNDGVNSVTINSVTLLGDSNFAPSASWTELSSLGVKSEPNGVGLPGAMGSGFDSQKNNKNCKWGCTFTFNANGAATYTPYWEISYTAGSSSFNKKTYNTTSSGEPINFSINVCDMRELLSVAALAKTAVNDSTYTLTTTQKENLVSVLNTINTKNLLSGTVYTQQSEINSYVSTIKSNLAANYYALNTLIDNFETLDASNYTQDSIKAVQDLILTFDYSYMYENQSRVNAYVTSLNNAISSLSEVPADYTALNDLVSQINLIDNSIYTTSSWNAVQSLISSINYNYTKSNQALVDAYVTSLNSALDSLEMKSADYTALNSLVSTINSLTSSNYTEETWKNLQDTLNSINYNLKITQQATVDAYVSSLNSLLDSLEEIDADYTEVNQLVAQVNGLNSAHYTKVTWKRVVNTINNIDYNLKISQQATVDEYATAIKNAIKFLTEVPADYTELDELIEEINQLNSSYYTSDSWDELVNIIDSIDYELTISSQSVINKYVTDLHNAINSLVEKAGDYSNVTAILSKISSLDSTLYTQQTWNSLQSIISSIDYTLKISSQSTIDGYVTSLENAISSLEIKTCDYSELLKALESAALIKQENDGRYDGQAFIAFKAALASANSVQSGLKVDADGINQSIIDSAAELLNGALTALNQSKKPVVSVTDKNGNVINEIPVDNSSAEVVFNDIKDSISTPVIDEDHAFAGWEDKSGNTVTDNTVISADLELVPVIELSKIKPNDNGNTIDVDRNTEKNVMVGLDTVKNTVSDIISSLENETIQIIVTKNNIELEQTERVGTGCVVKCVSSKNPDVVYEEVTVVVYGDVDGDGIIDGKDSSSVIENIFSMNTKIDKNSIYFLAADLNGDGTVDAVDYWLHNLCTTGVRPFDQTTKFFK